MDISQQLPSGGSRHASGRGETIVVQQKNQTVVSAWIPPSAIRRDALLRPNLNTNNVNQYKQHRHFNNNSYQQQQQQPKFVINKVNRQQDDQIHENEDIFRRSRGLLNRLTPEKFEKLSIEFCNLNIKNPKILKTIIVLIFDKALNEPAYSSLYAQLCQRLDQHVPNFDTLTPTNPQLSTFRKLLLSVCQHEFDNRASYLQIQDDKFEFKDEYERNAYNEYLRQIGKKKMLGNIKFIGELGKLDLLNEAILHKCIKTLLEKNKNEKYADMSDDLECLCKIMPTIGKKLDQNEAKKLMDQYFERMQKLKSIKDGLPQRIKFLIQDCIDLRAHNWEQRKIVLEQAPQRVTDLRPPEPPPSSKTPPPSLNPFINKMYEQLHQQPNMSLLNTINFKKINHGTIQSPYTSFNYKDDLIDDVSSNASTSSSQTDLNKKDDLKSNYVALGQATKRIVQREKTRSNSSSSISALSSTSSVAPSVSPPIQSFDTTLNLNNLNQLLTSINITTNSGHDDLPRQVEIFMENYLNTNEIDLMKQFSNEKLIEFIYLLISQSLSKRTDSDRLKISKLIVEIERDNRGIFLSCLRLLLENLNKLEQEHHCVKSNISIYISRALIDGLVDLNSLGQLMYNGSYYPLFFIILQQLCRLRAEEVGDVESKIWLKNLVEKSRINLLDMLNGERSNERLVQVLEDRQLDFIKPMLRYEGMLLDKICVESLNSSDLKKWIDDNLNQNCIESNDFINCLVTCIVRNATEMNKLNRQLIQKYADLLNEYLGTNRTRQLEALYAIQQYAQSNGLTQFYLTNLFNQMYELNLIDQETFKVYK